MRRLTLGLLLVAIGGSACWAHRKGGEKEDSRNLAEGPLPATTAHQKKEIYRFTREHPGTSRNIARYYLNHKNPVEEPSPPPPQDDEDEDSTPYTYYYPPFYGYPASPAPPTEYGGSRDDATEPADRYAKDTTKSKDKALTSPAFAHWLIVTPPVDGLLTMTYPGEGFPVRAVLFFTEDESGQRLNLETLEEAPFTTQMQVDHLTAQEGITIKYRDGYETTVRFPYPVPASLTGDGKSAGEKKTDTQK